MAVKKLTPELKDMFLEYCNLVIAASEAGGKDSKDEKEARKLYGDWMTAMTKRDKFVNNIQTAILETYRKER